MPPDILPTLQDHSAFSIISTSDRIQTYLDKFPASPPDPSPPPPRARKERRARKAPQSASAPTEEPLQPDPPLTRSFEPTLPPKLEKHRQNQILIEHLVPAINEKGRKSYDMNGHCNRWVDTRDPSRIIESMRVNFEDPVQKQWFTKTFYLIDGKYMRYPSFPEGEDGVWQTFDPTQKTVKQENFKEELQRWYRERERKENGNCCSLGHRMARIYGFDRRDELGGI